jgi:hypothetical protein
MTLSLAYMSDVLKISSSIIKTAPNFSIERFLKILVFFNYASLLGWWERKENLPARAFFFFFLLSFFYKLLLNLYI